jgi:hypothetical protein
LGGSLDITEDIFPMIDEEPDPPFVHQDYHKIKLQRKLDKLKMLKPYVTVPKDHSLEIPKYVAQAKGFIKLKRSLNG